MSSELSGLSVACQLQPMKCVKIVKNLCVTKGRYHVFLVAHVALGGATECVGLPLRVRPVNYVIA